MVAYVESTVADIEVANQLAHAVLGQSLDELAPQTRRLLLAVHAHVTAQAAELAVDASLVRFTRRQLREAIAWGDTQLKVHLARLVDLELLHVHRSESGTYGYELTWRPPTQSAGDGAGERGDVGGGHGRFLVGLTDPATLYDGNRSAQNPSWSGGGRPLVGGRSGPGRTPLNGVEQAPEQPEQAEMNAQVGLVPSDALIGLHDVRRGA